VIVLAIAARFTNSNGGGYLKRLDATNPTLEHFSSERLRSQVEILGSETVRLASEWRKIQS